MVVSGLVVPDTRHHIPERGIGGFPLRVDGRLLPAAMSFPLRHSIELPPPSLAADVAGPKRLPSPNLVDSYERLADVFHAVLSEHSLDALLDRIADEVGELIPHDSLTIFRADEQESILVPVLARDPWAAQILETRQNFGVGITGWAVAQREAVLANQAHLDPRVTTVPGTPADEEEALISVPLVARGSVKGALNIYRAGGDDPFSELEFNLAKRFGDAAALALDNAETTAALEHQARTDSLTGLFNHRVFHERLCEELAEARKSGSPLAVVMLDLDDFKHLNDTHGHATGDRVLKTVADSISRCSRGEDFACRVGGEEFAIILPNADAGAAAILASRIQRELEVGATVVAGRRLSASIGIAQAPEHSRHAPELAAYADAAMLEAKRLGKNRVVVFDAGTAGTGAPTVPNVRTTAHLKMLQSLSGKLNRLNDLQGIGDLIVRELLTLLDYHACRVYVREEDALVPIAHRHEFSASDGSEIAPLPLEIGDGVAGRAAEIGSSLLLENTLMCEFAQQLPGTEAVPESMIATPLLFDGQAIGVVVVSKLGLAQFDDDDVRLLEVLAGHAAVAVQNAALNAAERREAERAKALLVRSDTMLRLSHELVSANNITDVARLTVEAIVSTLGCASATVWLQNRPGEPLRLVRSNWEQNDGVPTLPTWIIGRVADGAAFWLDRRDVPTLACSEPNPASLAVAPIQLPNRRFGCVITGLDRRATTPEDLRLLDGIVDQARLALTNADRFASLESMFVSTVESLANALEASDESTSWHARAIREMAVAVGRDLGLNDTELKQLELAALFHDIGKIGVANHILSKPGPLTDEERELVERHPEIGQRILEPIGELAGIGRIVLHCHERYDGLGYPHGLSGDEIPLEARIILVCDAWDAMTSDRPYRRALPSAVAREELRAAAGSQFDPRVVTGFLALSPEPGRT
jgi:diguanylate cyclase (GGDEF)-like protein